jgi:hypothetical protein
VRFAPQALHRARTEIISIWSAIAASPPDL